MYIVNVLNIYIFIIGMNLHCQFSLNLSTPNFVPSPISNNSCFLSTRKSGLLYFYCNINDMEFFSPSTSVLPCEAVGVLSI